MVLAFAVTGPWATYRYIPGTTLLIPVALGIVLTATLGISVAAKIQPAAKWPVVLFFLFCGLILASVTWTLHREVWFQLAAWWLICFVLFFGTLQFVQNERRLIGLAIACALGALITLPLLSQDTYLYFAPEDRRFTVSGHNANHTGYVLAAAAFLILATLRLVGMPGIARTGLWMSVLLIAAELIMLGTRGAQIAAVLSLVSYFVAPRIEPHWRFAGATILAVAAVLVPLGVLSPLLAWVDTLSSRGTGDLSGRFPLWADALVWIGKSPVVGIGPGSFPTVSQLGMEAHNQILNVLLTAGWLGLILFSALAVSIVVSIVHHKGDVGSILCLMLACFYLPIMSSGHADLIAPMWLALGFTICLAEVSLSADFESKGTPTQN